MKSKIPLLCAIIALAGLGCSSTSPDPETAEITSPSVQTGTASYYAHKFHGRKTANGEIYDENKMTAAHRTLPFGTRVRVTNLDNDKSVELRVNDRGPFVEGRIIDVSYRAAGELDFVAAGLAEVRVEVLSVP
jgi:rare lipoprotein A